MLESVAAHLMDNRLRSSAGMMRSSMSAQVVSFTNGARADADLAAGFTAGYEFYRRYWNSNGYMVMSMVGMPVTTCTHALPGVTEDVHGIYVAYRHRSVLLNRLCSPVFPAANGVNAGEVRHRKHRVFRAILFELAHGCDPKRMMLYT